MTGLLSPTHIAVLLGVLILIFGARRLPELGRSLGSGMREFKDAVTGGRRPHPLGDDASASAGAIEPGAGGHDPGPGGEAGLASG